MNTDFRFETHFPGAFSSRIRHIPPSKFTKSQKSQINFSDFSKLSAQIQQDRDFKKTMCVHIQSLCVHIKSLCVRKLMMCVHCACKTILLDGVACACVQCVQVRASACRDACKSVQVRAYF